MANSQEKIALYNLADLKHTSDDAIPNYLNSLRFKQSHKLTDVRLALGYSAFAVAAACFLWDYHYGFQSTKYLTAAAVAIYTLLNGALTLWIWLAEHGTVYVGTAPSGETLRITTSTRKNVPQYDIEIEIRAKGATKAHTIKISRSFTGWFDAAGHLVAAPLQSVFATAVPCIGLLDPKRVSGHSTAYTPELLDALSPASVSVAVSTAETTGTETDRSGNKKNGKRRKA